MVPCPVVVEKRKKENKKKVTFDLNRRDYFTAPRLVLYLFSFVFITARSIAQRLVLLSVGTDLSYIPFNLMLSLPGISRGVFFDYEEDCIGSLL